MTSAAEATIPLTTSQSMIWTGQSLAGDAPLYNMAWRFDLRFAVDAAAFGAAVRHVVTGHDALRSVFVADASGVQQIDRADHLPLHGDLDFSREADPEAVVADWVQTRAARKLDLGRASYDSVLIKLAADHWVWFFNQHHIATDAWSGALVFRAVSDAYEAIVAGSGPDGPAWSPFAGFARDVAQARDTDALGDSLRHWEAQAKAAPRGSAPYGGVRDATVAASRRIGIDFGPDRTRAIRDLAASEGFRSVSADLSVFCLFLSVYAGYLARVTGDRTVVIAAPSHNRATPDLKATPGLFIEMFPITLTVDPEDSLQSLFRKALTEVMGYLRHAKPGVSTPATAAAARAVLNYIPVPYGTFAGHDTDVTWVHSGAHDPGHDLRMHVYDFEGRGTFRVEMDLNAAVFANTDANAPGAHFLRLANGCLSDPQKPLFSIALEDDATLPQSVSLGASVRRDLPHVLQNFADTVQSGPDAIAVKGPDGQLSFLALDQISDRIAADLQSRGVGAGDGVVIHASRSAGLVAAILGVLKTRAYFVPVPADTPDQRLEAIVSQVQPRCAIVDTSETAARYVYPKGTLALDALTGLPDLRLVPSPCEPNDIAYAIFTSGSTGQPKGVSVDHAGLLDYVAWAADSFGPDGAKSYPLYSSIGFDLTITSIFVPLITGGTVVVYPETHSRSDVAVLDVFADDAVDVVKLTPSHLALVCAQGKPVSRIGTLVMGGENLPSDLCRQAMGVLSPDIRIINEYGPTEAVVGAMIHRFDPARDTGVSVPIGQAADNTGIHVLDAGFNPVPVGVTGEVYISGRLARGYLGRDDLTAERFVVNPHEPDQRLYRTGDLARITASGDMVYLGRDDTQLKINGVRIEPAEVEHALNAIAGVTGSFVTSYTRTSKQRAEAPRACSRCGITDEVPDTVIGSDGICGICRDFETYKDRAQVYFDTSEALAESVASLAGRKTGQYDAIVLLSGGKDSTYALYRFAEMTPNILALTLDNGFISDGAKDNIRKVAEHIGVDHRFLTTPAMNDIFRDSLKRHSNVCQGCFKTIYTLAMRVALDEGIPAIVTGLSRGQFFETRLTPEQFAQAAPTRHDLEDYVLQARKSYHRMDDAISTHLATSDIQDDAVFDAISFIDVYRYIDVPVQEIYDFLNAHTPWTRPDDTGRSTNCLINDVGIYVHRQREGFHNYALPYSWDVRMGHKTRTEAVDELNDDIDTSKVFDILDRIGFDDRLLSTVNKPQLVAYVTGDPALSEAEVRSALRAALPASMIPMHIIIVDTIPLTTNGKVDHGALPEPDSHLADHSRRFVDAASDAERVLLDIYTSVIGTDRIGVTDNFYDIGGDSIAAIQIAILATEAGIPLDVNAVFEHQTIRDLASVADSLKGQAGTPALDAPLLDLGSADLDALGDALDRT